jgi:hypothetical protein
MDQTLKYKIFVGHVYLLRSSSVVTGHPIKEGTM